MADQDRLKRIKNVSLEDIRDHFNRTHFTKNMRFAIAGNITPGRKKQLIEMLEGMDLPTGKKMFDLPNEKPVKPEGPIYIKNDSVENIYMYLDTYINSRLDDKETEALILLNTYLSETIYSKILGTARERGILYDMSSAYTYNKNSSNWWFGAQVSEKNAVEYLNIIISEISKVKRGDITEQDIEATKQYALGRYQRSDQTVDATLDGYSGKFFFDKIVNDSYSIPDRIKGVKKEEIIDVCNKMFSEDIWSLGVLGNCGKDFVDQLYEQISVLWV